MGIPKGTRLTEVPKDKTIKIRYDAEIDAKLTYLCNITGKTKSQLFRDGIELQYADANK